MKRKEYIKAFDEKILEDFSVESVQAIREAQKLVLKKFNNYGKIEKLE